MNTTNIFVLIGKLSEPRASFYIIMGDRANPNIIYEMVITKLNWINPFKYVIPPFPLPHPDILNGCTGGEGIEQIYTAVSALFAFKAYGDCDLTFP